MHRLNNWCLVLPQEICYVLARSRFLAFEDLNKMADAVVDRDAYDNVRFH